MCRTRRQRQRVRHERTNEMMTRTAASAGYPLRGKSARTTAGTSKMSYEKYFQQRRTGRLTEFSQPKVAKAFPITQVSLLRKTSSLCPLDGLSSPCYSGVGRKAVTDA